MGSFASVSFLCKNDKSNKKTDDAIEKSEVENGGVQKMAE